MNFLDWIIIILIGVGVVKGLSDGLVRQIVSVTGIILGTWIAIKYADAAGKFLLQLYEFPEYVWKPLSFLLPFVLVIIAGNLLATIFQKLLSEIGLGPINHVGGALFGGIKFILLVSVLLNLFQFFDKNNRIIKAPAKSASWTYYPVLKVAPTIFPYMQKYFNHEKEINIVDKKEEVG